MESHDKTTGDGYVVQQQRRSQNSATGIGNIFLCSPGEASQETYWEITCTVKSCPEDFVVREIGGIPPLSYIKNYRKERRCDSFVPKIADVYDDRSLPLEHTLRSALLDTVAEAHPQLDNLAQTLESSSDFSSCIDNSKLSNKGTFDINQFSILTLDTPIDVIQALLQEFDGQAMQSSLRNISSPDSSSSSSITSVADYCQALELLHTQALDDISHSNQSMSIVETSVKHLPLSNSEALEGISNLSQYETEADKNVITNNSFIVIPPFTNSSLITFHGNSSMQPAIRSTSSGNRGTFHRACALHYPCLLTCTLSTQEIQSYTMSSYQGYDGSDVENKWIKVCKDTSLHGLIPFLTHVKEDLVPLYTYWKRGPHMECALSRSNNIDNRISLRLKPDLDKTQRQTIHHIIRSISHDLETETAVNTDSSSNLVGGRMILVYWSRHALRKTQIKAKNTPDLTKKSSAEGHNQICNNQLPNNTLFVLKKTNIEHAHAIYQLCSAFKCKASDITFAGIKDKVATTYQFVTVRNVSPHRVESNSKNLVSSLEIGNCKSVPWVLSNGDLKGNEFHLVLRNIKRKRVISGKDIHSDLSHDCCPFSYMSGMVNRVLKLGFINYYGEQRVGVDGLDSEGGLRPTDIGKAMLQNDFQRAIDLIMQGRAELDSDGHYLECPDCRTIRRTWIESDRCPVTTLKVFPKGLSIMHRERTILQGLKRFGKNEYLAAFRCLPYNVRMFWVHVYQSYIFNLMVTERIVRFGQHPIVGDLIFSDDSKSSIQYVDNPAAIKFSQILLPLPGYGVKYPNNEIGSLYREVLHRDGVSFDKKSVSESTAHGSYRHIIAMPHSLTWRIKDSVKDEAQLPSDVVVNTAEFQFSLPSGCYATMFLRELLMTTSRQGST